MKNIYDNAMVTDNARISDNAKVSGNAWIYGNAEISGNARIYGDARIIDNTKVSGNARIYGEADIASDDDWFTLTINGKTITGYKSRCPEGYEINEDGKPLINDMLLTHIIALAMNIKTWGKHSPRNP